tara:strand:- start:1072 stop:1938 length:867 start_codon:yes stop_codon:yes gene_type:complete
MNLIIGTAQFGLDYGIANQDGLISLEEGKKILDYSIQSGIDAVDTAVLYGKSETNLGIIGVEKLKVITKIPKIPNSDIDILEWVEETVQGSLERLNINEIYAVLLHKPDDLLGPSGKEIYSGLLGLKNSGIVSKIGISSYSIDEIRKVLDSFPLDIIQTPLNIIDRSLVASNLIDDLKKQEIEIHVRSIFLQGALLLPENKIPKELNNWAHIWRKWTDWLKTNDIDPIHACLSYVKSIKGIDKIIIGVDSLEQIMTIVEKYNKKSLIDFPDISSDDHLLINPSNWQKI